MPKDLLKSNNLFRRNIDNELLAWKNSSRRKPLILEGARQVGKTFSLSNFGKSHFKKVVYLNFEKEEKIAQFFDKSLDPIELIKLFKIYTEIDIKPDDTLIFFDEIQECPKALNSLKYFCEHANDYYVVAAGSLLGIKTANEKGFPVGKVNFLHLYPLSFFEFLSATNNHQLRQYLEEISQFESIVGPIHSKLQDLLKFYYFIGGMPEVVSEYVKTDDLKTVRVVQNEILSSYEKDFAKHAPKSEIMKITSVWYQIHRQLAKENKKFIFSYLKESARGKDYEYAIQWLKDAGLIHKNIMVNTPKFPLSAYGDINSYKIYMLDVGLLCAQSGLDQKVILEPDRLFIEFKGALTENFIASELKAYTGKDSYYWSCENKAEVDFLVERENEIFPLEIKSGETSKKKSLKFYEEKYGPKKLLRASLMNLKHDGNIYNLPLYLISRIFDLV